jgi:hypothetical protein
LFIGWRQAYRKTACGTGFGAWSRLETPIGAHQRYLERCSSDASNARAHDGQNLANTLAVDPFDLKSSIENCGFTLACEVAIAHQSLPDWLNALLPSQSNGVRSRSDVFEKHQTATRF